jgi:FkbM family methyltransferase
MINTIFDIFSLLKGAGPKGLIEFMGVISRSISFSQYAEDIHTSRIMPIGDEGFYVDVGAAYPVLNSNTYRFYLKGWSGVTIEPNPLLAAQHRIVRPRDIVVPQGVSVKESLLKYYRFIPADFNTFDPEFAQLAIAKGARPDKELQISTRPLRSILEEHVGQRKIDLMSIDCEGMDFEVLQSSNWSRFRPNMLMVEDHQPSFEASTQSPICRFLKQHDYIQIARLSYTSFFASKAFYLKN